MPGKPKLNGKTKYHQGKFIPRHPEKVIGNIDNLLFRSGWEKSFFEWCDMNEDVVNYCSEELVIPYINPLDNEKHKYFVDFVIFVRQKDGSIKKFAVEIKPFAETRPPVRKRSKKLNMVKESSYRYEMETFIKNQAKWKAADALCKQLGMQFIVVTENELLKGKK